LWVWMKTEAAAVALFYGIGQSRRFSGAFLMAYRHIFLMKKVTFFIARM
jgi:hypothetical protein